MFCETLVSELLATNDQYKHHHRRRCERHVPQWADLVRHDSIERLLWSKLQSLAPLPCRRLAAAWTSRGFGAAHASMEARYCCFSGQHWLSAGTIISHDSAPRSRAYRRHTARGAASRSETVGTWTPRAAARRFAGRCGVETDRRQATANVSLRRTACIVFGRSAVHGALRAQDQGTASHVSDGRVDGTKVHCGTNKTWARTIHSWGLRHVLSCHNK